MHHLIATVLRRLLPSVLAASFFLTGVVDATACQSEIAMHDAVAHSDAGQPVSAPLPEQDGDHPDQHATCAHGHCHHGSQVVRTTALEMDGQSRSVDWRHGAQSHIPPAILDELSEPPRI